MTASIAIRSACRLWTFIHTAEGYISDYQGKNSLSCILLQCAEAWQNHSPKHGQFDSNSSHFGEALKNPLHKDVLHGGDAASASGFVQDVHSESPESSMESRK